MYTFALLLMKYPKNQVDTQFNDRLSTEAHTSFAAIDSHNG